MRQGAKRARGGTSSPARLPTLASFADGFARATITRVSVKRGPDGGWKNADGKRRMEICG